MSTNGPNNETRHEKTPIPASTDLPSNTTHELSKNESEQPPTTQSPRSSSHDSQNSDDTERDHATAPPALSSSRGLSPPGHEHETTAPDVREELEPFDWEGLEARFCAKMEECSRQEERIGEEFREWVELFKVWSCSTAQVHGGERARKRLRTRIASVQGAEQQLEENRQHYIKVVQAFESALALLGGL